jgi:hypothetical protein
MNPTVSEQVLRYGGGGDTNLSVVAVCFVLVASLVILVCRRKYVIAVMLVVSFVVPLGQKVVIFGLHFTMFRIVILFSWLRIFLSRFSGDRDTLRFRLSPIDKALVLWVLSSVVTFTLLWGEVGAFIDRLGFLYNAFGTYFLFRFLCRTKEDVDRTIKALAFICAILAVCMLNEQFTGRNLFAVFGGVPEFTFVREGRLRSEGPFAHPILAGTFGGTLFPLFAGLWWQGGKSKATPLVGMISSTAIAFTSMSSTPLLAYFAGIFGLFFWLFRKQMRLWRWCISICLIGLHLVMKAPVWALIARVDLVGGSSADHRYQLVNQFITRFGEWWLLGTRQTAQWGFEMSDLSNQYVEIGVTGGLLSLVLFMAIIVYCFKALGRARAAKTGDPGGERYLWVLGAALFSNLVAFFGISYFDQTTVSWYALLAFIASSTTAVLKPVLETVSGRTSCDKGMPALAVKPVIGI